MQLSVLVSVYQKEKPNYLDQALESIVKQTRMPDQIVIIKDGTLTEELEKVIQKYVHKYKEIIKIYTYKENQGLGYALQKGVIQCDYDYIARMDTDDIAKPKRFEIQMAYLEKHPEIDILGSYIQEYDENMKTKKSIRRVPLSCEEIYNNIGIQSPFNHCTIIAKKSAIIKAGNYEAKPIEDYRLWIQMCINKCKMENLPETLVNFRTGKPMYKRRTGIKYLKDIKKVEDILLKNQFITHTQYGKNMIIRTILAIMPCKMKMYFYPKIVRK